jgi:asparagine synthase (glutamine-hydrolysing)
VDSSSLVATIADLMGDSEGHAASLGERQQTFSSVYEDSGPWNERRYIDTILGRVGAAGRFVVPTLDRLWGDLDDLAWHQEEPFDSASMFAQWCVMDLAQQHGVRVVLDGQGADEVLGGYPPALSTHLGELLSRGKYAQAIRFSGHVRSVKGADSGPLILRAVRKHLRLSMLGRMSGRGGGGYRNMMVGSCLSDSVAGLLTEEDFTAHPFMDRIPTLGESLAYILQEDLLPHLLRFEDRNSMAFSIEGRVPYLDSRLVEFMFARGHALRVKEGWTKWIHRAAFNGSLPDEIVWRRDKVAFATPQDSWMQTSANEIKRMLSDSAILDYLDNKRPDELLAPGSGLLWRWVSVAKWLRVFSDRTSSRPSPMAALGSGA